MKFMKLAGWVVMTFMLSNLMQYPAHFAVAAPAQAAASVQGQPVSINKASSEELQTVRGIGPALAERIISFRQEVGGFKTVEQLKEVKGIGDAKFEKMKSQLTM